MVSSARNEVNRVMEVTSLGKKTLTVVCALLGVLLISAGAVWAEEAEKAEKSEKAEQAASPAAQADEKKSDKLFDFTAPDGFEEAPPEEPGMRRWTKGNGEILAVVGDQFSDKPKELFDKLVEGAKKNKRYEAVEPIDLEGGLAFTLREKKGEQAARLRTWRVIVLARGKILNIDFSAPDGEFDSFLPDFEAALKSFKLTPKAD